MERLDPRVGVVWVVAAAVRAMIVGVLLVASGTVVSELDDAIPLVPQSDTLVQLSVGLALAYAAVSVVVAWLQYQNWRFELQDDALYIERGVFTRIKTVAPYVRVQHVDSRQGPVERAVELATVAVYTAGSRGSDVAIPGLTPERAEELREELRRLAIESSGEDAV